MWYMNKNSKKFFSGVLNEQVRFIRSIKYENKQYSK